jgi:hypothetical protein
MNFKINPIFDVQIEKNKFILYNLSCTNQLKPIIFKNHVNSQSHFSRIKRG